MKHSNTTPAKIPILDTGKFKQWKFRIQQYLQHEHYALWEVIEVGDSYEFPKNDETTCTTSDGKKGRTVAVTAEDMQKRRNDVKARTTLLLAFPDEHQLRFSKYKTAQELWAAILKTFGGNEATKKTKKNLLKQHLAPEWLMHTIVWRNRSELDTMSLDDLYNHLKVYELEVQKKSESNSQNMAFISSAKNSSGKEEVNTASIPTASTNVSPASANIGAASISQDTAFAYITSQSNGFDKSKVECFNCKRTGKKITIQGTDVAGFDKSKVECFNCHKMGHFARECRAPRSQDKGRKDNYRKGSKVEEHAPKALMAIDRVGWDWSFMVNEEENHALVADEEAPIEFALMAKTSTEVFDNSLCSKACLSQVEARLVEFKNQEVKFCEKIRGLELKVEFKTETIEYLTNQLESLKNEKEVLPPPLAQVYYPPKKDMSWTRLPKFANDTITDYTRPSSSVESNPNDLQNSSSSAFENGESIGSILSKPEIKFVKPTDSLTVAKTDKRKLLGSLLLNMLNYIEKLQRGLMLGGNSQFNIDDKGYWDSGCSRHMTGNISYLSYYEPYDGGYSSFGQGGCKITGKGTIKTGKLEFENVYFMKDLKYNLFSVSQICDNKNIVLFTNSECIVLGRNFKLTDDTNVLLRTPRQHNMYTIDLNNVVPHKDLTCLVAKASADECMLWHKRLGHLNFKTMNRLVRYNLVRGLPSKCFHNNHTCVACLKGKQHKASYKTKLVNSVTKPLYTLHMDLFGPTPDETSGILRSFITGIENLKELKERYQREFSNIRTPQQNGVAKRRNKTLIEAARTMFADAKLLVTFWVEAVNTAYYVQNRVLVNKYQNKTPYELFNGRSPAIGFLKPFGCHVMILYTLDNLGKFKAKGDKGYFIGYFMSSKALRVCNKRTKRVEENLHVDFLENKPIEKGASPN
nr:hypothetical protein [Tanacetum cinerariifolium]